MPGRWCDEQCMMVNRCMEDLCKEELTITLCTSNAVILANENEHQLVKDEWQESTSLTRIDGSHKSVVHVQTEQKMP